MNNENQVHELKKFRESLRRLFKTEDGIVVKKMLEDMYIHQTSLVVDSQLATGYHLGQKELIQGLMNDATREDKKFIVNNIGD